MIHHRWQESAACRDAWSTAAADGVVGVVPPLPVDRYERVSEFIRPQSQVIGWMLWLTHGSINCSARYYGPHLRPATHTTVRETYKYLRSWLWNVGPTLTVRQVQGWLWSRPRVGIKKKIRPEMQYEMMYWSASSCRLPFRQTASKINVGCG